METMSIILAVSAKLSEDKMPIEMNTTTWFVIGVFVAILLFIYLTYTLIKPEKF